MKVIDSLKCKPVFGRIILADIRYIFIVIVSKRRRKFPPRRKIIVYPNIDIALNIRFKNPAFGWRIAEYTSKVSFTCPPIVNGPGKLKFIA
jgi:hypothetical protein